MAARIRVSVVVCNHNYGHFIEQAIESALNQTHPPLEVVVVDDGSTDDSVQRAKAIGHPLVRLITQANGGQMAAYNTGFAAVSGDVVVFLDSDDRLLPEALAHIAQAFDNDQVARAQFRLALIDHAGRPTGAVIPTHMADGDLHMLMRQGVIFLAAPGSGNAYRVSALARLMPLPFDAREKHGADFFTGYGMALLGQVRVVGEKPLAEYRVHTQEAVESLNFGNARLAMTQSEMLERNYQWLRQWLAQRLPGTELAPSPVIDFSIEKQDFARSIFQAPGYWAGLRAGALRWPHLKASVRHRASPLWLKWGLMAWAAVVLVVPRPVGWPLARFVCNPSSRGGL